MIQLLHALFKKPMPARRAPIRTEAVVIAEQYFYKHGGECNHAIKDVNESITVLEDFRAQRIRYDNSTIDLQITHLRDALRHLYFWKHN